jgi:two-component system NtrC family sensor kinase
MRARFRPFGAYVALMVEVGADSLRAERQLLASVLSTIPHLVFWKDLEHRHLGCNDAYARFRGLPAAQELTGLREMELPGHPLGALIADIEDQVLAAETAVVDQPVVLAAADGSPVTMLLTVLTGYENGLPGGVMGVGTDITRITALERQVAQASRLESIGQLAAGLAHEISTPVQYVSDNVRFLADSLTDVFEALRTIPRRGH